MNLSVIDLYIDNHYIVDTRVVLYIDKHYLVHRCLVCGPHAPKSRYIGRGPRFRSCNRTERFRDKIENSRVLPSVIDAAKEANLLDATL